MILWPQHPSPPQRIKVTVGVWDFSVLRSPLHGIWITTCRWTRARLPEPRLPGGSTGTTAGVRPPTPGSHGHCRGSRRARRPVAAPHRTHLKRWRRIQEFNEPFSVFKLNINVFEECLLQLILNTVWFYNTDYMCIVLWHAHGFFIH